MVESMAENFAQIRLQNKNYKKIISSSPLYRYLHREGWIDTAVNKELIFSHRNTWYDHDSFTENFHTHTYYELIFYIKGNVDYLDENLVINPSPYMITWTKPGTMHSARLLSPSQYERYVIYFTDKFFDINGRITPLTDFINHSTGNHMVLSEKKFGELLTLLKRASEISEIEQPYAELVLKALFVEIFYMLNSQKAKIQEGTAMTDTMGEVKRYIDANYATITSVSQIADHFFYSREHLSRKFMQAFNISVAHYLSRCRITESLALLKTMSVADAAYTVGFQSQSAYIKAFKKYMYCLPSEYKIQNK